MAIKHSTIATKADEAGAEVNKDEWNAAHTIENGTITSAHLAANSIDSDAYVDGSIDEEHLANDIVTLAKMAGGTDGNLITYDADGNPAHVATGTDGQVLTSNGAGAAPTFQAASGGFSTVYKTADETINSDDTLTDDADLQFSVDANSVYFIFEYIVVNSHASADYREAFSVPSGTSGTAMASNGIFRYGVQSFSKDITDSLAFPTDATNQTWSNYIILITDSTSGTIAYQWAQNTSNAGDTVLKKGSLLMYKKLN